MATAVNELTTILYVCYWISSCYDQLLRVATMKFIWYHWRSVLCATVTYSIFHKIYTWCTEFFCLPYSSLWCDLLDHLLQVCFIIPSASTKLKGGYTGFTLSVRLSVPLSICGQNRVRSVSSTIVVGSISYLHSLSSNFRRCVACNACFKIQIWNLKFW